MRETASEHGLCEHGLRVADRCRVNRTAKRYGGRYCSGYPGDVGLACAGTFGAEGITGKAE